MKNRNRIITTLLLTISLILSTTMPIMAEEITEDIIEDTSIDSVDEDYNVFSSVDSVEDELNVQSFGDTTVLGDTPPSTYEKHYWHTYYKRDTNFNIVDSWDDFLIKEQSAYENDYITNPTLSQTVRDNGSWTGVDIHYTPGATDEMVLVGAIDERSDIIEID